MSLYEEEKLKFDCLCLYECFTTCYSSMHDVRGGSGRSSTDCLQAVFSDWLRQGALCVSVYQLYLSLCQARVSHKWSIARDHSIITRVKRSLPDQSRSALLQPYSHSFPFWDVFANGIYSVWEQTFFVPTECKSWLQKHPKWTATWIS